MGVSFSRFWTKQCEFFIGWLRNFGIWYFPNDIHHRFQQDPWIRAGTAICLHSLTCHVLMCLPTLQECSLCVYKVRLSTRSLWWLLLTCECGLVFHFSVAGSFGSRVYRHQGVTHRRGGTPRCFLWLSDCCQEGPRTLPEGWGCITHHHLLSQH